MIHEEKYKIKALNGKIKELKSIVKHLQERVYSQRLELRDFNKNASLEYAQYLIAENKKLSFLLNEKDKILQNTENIIMESYFKHLHHKDDSCSFMNDLEKSQIINDFDRKLQSKFYEETLREETKNFILTRHETQNQQE